jgi:hypothetical protein
MWCYVNSPSWTGWLHALLLKLPVQRKPAGACHSIRVWKQSLRCRSTITQPINSQWSDPSVYTTLTLSLFCLILFLLVEIFVAVEPVLPPFLLTQKVPILVGASNALVAVCNLSVTYFFPVWFQTVMLSSASTAGTLTVHCLKGPDMTVIFFYCDRITSFTKQCLHINRISVCWVISFSTCLSTDPHAWHF